MSDSRPTAWNSSLPVSRTPLSRNTELRRSGPIGSKKSAEQRARDEERKAEEFARTYHSVERVIFVKFAGPCEVPGCEERPENAHLDTEGTARKSAYTRIVRLCAGHHRTRPDSLHRLGSVERFDETHDTDLELAADGLENEWRDRGGSWVALQKETGAFDAMRRAA